MGGIHGAKWLDENGNGQWDPTEPGLPGWTIRLEGSNGVMSTTVTGENGRYWLMGLPSGAYTVTEPVKLGWEQTWPQAGYYTVTLHVLARPLRTWTLATGARRPRMVRSMVKNGMTKTATERKTRMNPGCLVGPSL